MDSMDFGLEGEWTPDNSALVLMNELPNSIPFNLRLQPDRWHTIPEKVTYCVDCESQARMKRGPKGT